MSLRSAILSSAIPLLPNHSFTRQTLVDSLASLPASSSSSSFSSSSSSSSSTANPESIVDVLFGTGNSSPSKALFEAWAEAGRKDMTNVVEQGVGGMLERRLEWSSRVGEHLVEAYALSSAPSTSHAIPLPALDKIPLLSNLLNIKLPPLYTPPSSPPSSQPSTLSPSSSDSPSSSPSTSSHSLPLLSMNPLGPVEYAWRIADTTLTEMQKRQKARVGSMGEPTGSGPEWYTSRLGLSLVYLAAESQLLQPVPNLALAKVSLSKNLQRYQDVLELVENGEKTVGSAFGYLELFGRSWAGIIRSRGW